MFPELSLEFDPTQFPTEFTYKMEEIETDEEKKFYEYEIEVELPYGSFEH